MDWIVMEFVTYYACVFLLCFLLLCAVKDYRNYDKELHDIGFTKDSEFFAQILEKTKGRKNLMDKIIIINTDNADEMKTIS